MTQLRITTGTAKNKKLKTPDIEGFRPVQEIVKQAIFGIVSDKIQDAVCLDLFAGSGNMGIEAISRGAKHCDFVDTTYEATHIIEENLKNCGFEEQGEVYLKDAAKFAKGASEFSTQNLQESGIKGIYDLIFVDPFYKDTSQVHLFKLLATIIRPNAMVFYLYGAQQDINGVIKDSGFKVVTTRKFGMTTFSLLQQE